MLLIFLLIEVFDFSFDLTITYHDLIEVYLFGFDHIILHILFIVFNEA